MAGATGWWLRTEGSSPSATPSSTDRWVGPCSTHTWWGWQQRPTAGATGWWRRTAGCSPSAVLPSHLQSLADRAGRGGSAPAVIASLAVTPDDGAYEPARTAKFAVVREPA